MKVKEEIERLAKEYGKLKAAVGVRAEVKDGGLGLASKLLIMFFFRVNGNIGR